jgi:hypothetical protein
VYLEVFSQDPERDQQIRRALQPDKSMSFFHRALWHSDFKEKDGATRVPNFNFNFNLLPDCLMCLVIVTVFFGGLHCVAWDLAFPSYVELTLWHAASITTTVIPTLIFGSQYVVTMSREGTFKPGYENSNLEIHPFHSLMVTLAYIFFLLGRLSLVALAAPTLRSMPAGVYVST